MRYFLVSDVHGEFDKMIQALNDAGFNKDNDTLVSLGDLFDRGDKNINVLKYVMSLPNRILVGGNHDYRLEDLYRHYWGITQTDKHNGTLKTINEFNYRGGGFYDNSLLDEYFKSLVGAVEFTNYIGTHAWALGSPADEDYNWRQSSMRGWKEASWTNTLDHWRMFKDFPDKKLIVGHFHACLFREPNIMKMDDEKIKQHYNNPANHNIFEDEHIVVIDGCSNYYCGKVNVFIIEDNPAAVKTYGYNRPMTEKDFM